MGVRLWLVVTMSMLLSQSCFAKELMTIYFMPFTVQTYVPVTKEDVASKAHEK